MAAAIAGAPCSVGVGGDPTAGVDADEFVAVLAEAGYSGVDLGPPGYLDARQGLGETLERHRFGVSGGWVQLGTDGTGAVALDAVLAACDLSRSMVPDLPHPRPTLAAPSHPDARIGAPARLDDRGWSALTEAIGDATRRCRERGHEPAFHPHVGTTVETPEDTERLLQSTDLMLCFDTGHVALGGGEPLPLLRAWRERVGHLHLKDVRADVCERLRHERATPERTWSEGVFCALGDGDLPMEEMLDELAGWAGWVVVEQDTTVTDEATSRRALEDQRRNRAFLRYLGW